MRNFPDCWYERQRRIYSRETYLLLSFRSISSFSRRRFSAWFGGEKHRRPGRLGKGQNKIWNLVPVKDDWVAVASVTYSLFSLSFVSFLFFFIERVSRGDITPRSLATLQYGKGDRTGFSSFVSFFMDWCLVAMDLRRDTVVFFSLSSCVVCMYVPLKQQ